MFLSLIDQDGSPLDTLDVTDLATKLSTLLTPSVDLAPLLPTQEQGVNQAVFENITLIKTLTESRVEQPQPGGIQSAPYSQLNTDDRGRIIRNFTSDDGLGVHMAEYQSFSLPPVTPYRDLLRDVQSLEHFVQRAINEGATLHVQAE